VEGFKRALIPKLEIHRPGHGRPPLHQDDANIVAVASDAPVATVLPVLDINDHGAIAEFIMRYLRLAAR
jgi:molybdopterin-guanine dinucleotide biosynthesis protein B